jgi:hypothetical protein
MKMLHIRSSRLLVISKFSDITLDSTQYSIAEQTGLQTRSLITRWSLVPNSKINFYPELVWSSKDHALDNGSYNPYRKEISPKAVLYTRNFIPGITSYINSEASYIQDNFDNQNETRNLGFEREAVAQVDITPGTYYSLLNPVSVRFDLIRNAEDSLVGMSENYNLYDLGLSWQSFAENVQSLRYDSDAIQFTWTPHASWLFYQSFSEIRATSMDNEQFFSSRIEWKPRSNEQVILKYTLNRTSDNTDNGMRHRPGIEWYKRWSSSTYTRGQIFATLIDEENQNSTSISPGVYLDQKLRFPGQWGQVTWRTDILLTYLEQSLPTNEEKMIFGGYTRLDWNILSKLVFRIRFDGDYEKSYTLNSFDFTWSLETRLSAHF